MVIFWDKYIIVFCFVFNSGAADCSKCTPGRTGANCTFVEATLPDKPDHFVCSAGNRGKITNFRGKKYDISETGLFSMIKTQHLSLMVSTLC